MAIQMCECLAAASETADLDTSLRRWQLKQSSRWGPHLPFWFATSSKVKGLAPIEQQEIITQATRLINESVELNLVRVQTQSVAIRLWFRGIDGVDKVLGRALMPGRPSIPKVPKDRTWVNLDTAETWNPTKLLYVVTHELCHALGVNHIEDQSSIMFPRYIRRKLTKIDPITVAHFEARGYKVRSNKPAPKPPNVPLPDTISWPMVLKVGDATYTGTPTLKKV